MADFGKNLKSIWQKGMEAIGNTASNIANNTKFKLDEMNLVNRKREILNDFGAFAYTLWQKGERFPEELEKLLTEVSSIEEKLNDLRTEHFAGVVSQEEPLHTDEKTVSGSETDRGEAVPTETKEEVLHVTENSEEAEESVPSIRVENPSGTEEEKSPLSSVINDLFDKPPQVDDMAEKMNTALDSLGDSLKEFSKKIDEGLNDIQKNLNDERGDSKNQ